MHQDRTVDTDFADLCRRYPNAALLDDGSGGHWVEIYDVPLPDGWSKRSTTVRFHAPTGYPFAFTDGDHWVDEDLRLESGGFPPWSDQPANGRMLMHFRWLCTDWHGRWTGGAPPSLLQTAVVIRLGFVEKTKSYYERHPDAE
jgi:hypothetical protein